MTELTNAQILKLVAEHPKLTIAEMAEAALARPPWTERERTAIAELMQLKDLSEAQMIRQAVRLYQLVALAEKGGLSMGFYDDSGKRTDFLEFRMKPPEIVARFDDHRPSNCRNRLSDEYKPHPRSGCAYCGTGGITGCPFERSK